MPEGLDHTSEDAHKGDFENIYELQEEIRQNLENEADAEQNEFEVKTKQGFERFSTMTKEDFVKICTVLSVEDRFRITALISTILSGKEKELDTTCDKFGGIPFQKTLDGLKMLELGSYYGDAPDIKYFTEHPTRGELAYYSASDYTGIDLDEPKDCVYEEELFSGKNGRFEFAKMDVRKLDQRFPDKKWDMIFGNAFFGYPTKNLGKKGEVALLQMLSRHLRNGGVMWFKNNDRMLMNQEDIEILGFEYINRDDLYRRLWAIRKTGKSEVFTE